MVFRASEYGESKVGKFLDSPRWWGHWGQGGEGGLRTSQALQPSGQIWETTGLPEGCHLLRSTEGRKEEGVVFLPFHVLMGPEEHEWGGGVSSALPILSNFLRGHLLKRRLGTLLLSVYRTAFNCPAFQKYFSNS